MVRRRKKRKKETKANFNSEVYCDQCVVFKAKRFVSGVFSVTMEQEHQRSSSSDLLCCLCKSADETDITGPLSCKHGTAAHQNCLVSSRQCPAVNFKYII